MNKIHNYCVTLYPEVTPRKTGWGYADHFSKLLMTKICDFAAIDTPFMTVAAGTVTLNISYEGL